MKDIKWGVVRFFTGKNNGDDESRAMKTGTTPCNLFKINSQNQFSDCICIIYPREPSLIHTFFKIRSVREVPGFYGGLFELTGKDK